MDQHMHSHDSGDSSQQLPKKQPPYPLQPPQPHAHKVSESAVMWHGHHLKAKWHQRFLVALAESGNVALAARAAGVNRDTPFVTAERDPAFSAAFAEAKASLDDAMEQSVYKRGLGWQEPVIGKGGVHVGDKHVYSSTEALAWLKVKRSAEWGDKRTVDVRHGVDVESVAALKRELSLEDAKALLAKFKAGQIVEGEAREVDEDQA